MAKNLVPPFDAAVLLGIAEVLGATDNGLTGSEIAHTLAQARVPDVSPTITKRHRLFNALAERQNKDRVGNCVVAFMTEAMAPVRYQKAQAGDSWQHTRIRLRPANPAFEPIVLTGAEEGEPQVIAEVLEVLQE